MDLDAAAEAIDAFLRALGHGHERDPSLVGTGARVATMFADELLAGYAVDVDTLLSQSVFSGRSDLVVVRDIPVVTICPHHLMPSAGEATLAFAPRDHLLGIGTVARAIDAYARRLSLQEQIGQRTVAAFQKHLAPWWVACRISLSHACMTTRRDGAKGARVETLAVAGDFDEATVHRALAVRS
jgi:GTP cyclohydrolase IA